MRHGLGVSRAVAADTAAVPVTSLQLDRANVALILALNLWPLLCLSALQLLTYRQGDITLFRVLNSDPMMTLMSFAFLLFFSRDLPLPTIHPVNK
jgi:hypothetical protein